MSIRGKAFFGQTEEKKAELERLDREIGRVQHAKDHNFDRMLGLKVRTQFIWEDTGFDVVIFAITDKHIHIF